MEDSTKDLPEIPISVLLPTGMTVDTSSDVWLARAYDKSPRVKFDWSLFERTYGGNRVIMSPRSQHLTKLFMAHRMTQIKLVTVRNCFFGFTNFHQWLSETSYLEIRRGLPAHFDWSIFDGVMAHDYADWTLRKYGYNQYHLSNLKVFYDWGIARQFAGFDLVTHADLRGISPIRNQQGQLVRSRNAIRGPLSSDERNLIIEAIKAGIGTKTQRAMVMLSLELGLRPISVTRIRNKHLKRIETSQLILYQLDVPRAKKRNHQEETKRRPISEQLGRLLETFKGDDDNDLLFKLSENSPDKYIKKALMDFVKAAKIISPRTGKPLHLTSRRIRYTLATHLAEEGASKFHIAEVLDHNQLDTVEVYVETKSSIADQVALATDAVMEPLINRFLGKLLDSATEPGLEPTSNTLILSSTAHLQLPVLNVGGIGMCGRNVRRDGLCQLFPPFSCYLCPNFLASRTGHHRQQLEGIEQFITENKGQVDERILMQLDEVCQVIREVLRQVESKSQQSEIVVTTR